MGNWTAFVLAAVLSATPATALAQRAGGAGPAPVSGGIAPPAGDEGTAAISGVVTERSSRRPLAGVMVYLGYQGKGAVGRLSRQISDDKGRFVFTDLAAGTNYFINTSRPGYLDGHFSVGAGGLLGGLITLTDGQWFADANVTMERLGSISGTITDERGEPVVGAFVRLLTRITVAGKPQLAAGLVAKTDDRGAYRLGDLTPGRYIVEVPNVQQSFAASMTPAEIAGLRPADIGPGRLIPEPPPALEAQDGSRLIVGTYLLPPVAGGRPTIYPPTFYPGATSMNAANNIEVKAGEERSGVSFSLVPVPATTVSGVISGPPEVLPGLAVRLLPDGLEDLGSGSEVATATLDGSGRYTFFNVPAGNYAIDIRRSLSELQFRTPLSPTPASFPATPGQAGRGGGSGGIMSGPRGATYSTRGSTGDATYFLRAKLAVGPTPLSNANFALRRGGTIRGKLEMDDGSAIDDTAARLPVYAEPADGNMGLGLISGTRPSRESFQIDGLLDAEYMLRLLSGAATSFSVNGEVRRTPLIDMSSGRDMDVVITLTNKRAELNGSITDARGAATADAVVIAFPIEREQWSKYGLSPSRLRGTPATSSGTYRFQSLPAGDYFIAAVPGDQADVWQDPQKLDAMSRTAVRVTLVWGETKTQALKVERVK